MGWTFTRKVVIHPKLMARARVTENSNPVVTILQDWNDPARVGRGESDHTIDWYDILAGMTRYYKGSNVCGDPSCVRFQQMLQTPTDHPKKLNMKTCRTTDAKQKSAKALRRARIYQLSPDDRSYWFGRLTSQATPVLHTPRLSLEPPETSARPATQIVQPLLQKQPEIR